MADLNSTLVRGNLRVTGDANVMGETLTGSLYSQGEVYGTHLIGYTNNSSATFLNDGTISLVRGSGSTTLTLPAKTDTIATLGDIPSTIAWSNVTGKPTFATVATSGSYNDLSDKPTIPTDTWRTVKIDDTSIGNNELNIKHGTNVSFSTSNGTVTISATDTTYSLATTSDNGLMPKLASASVASQSQTTKFLREDGTWSAPSYTSDYIPLSGTGDLTGNIIPKSTSTTLTLGSSQYPFNSVNTISVNTYKSDKTKVASYQYNAIVHGTIGSSPTLYTLTLPAKTGTLAVTGDIPTSLDDLPDGSTRKLADYLPLSGGTLNDTTSDTPLYLQGSTASTYLGFKNSSGTTLGYYYVNSSNKPGFYYNGTSTLISLAGHTHTKSEITDFPASLPANGGNADTVDGFHAGVENGRVAELANFPGMDTLKSLGFLTSDYGTSSYGYPTDVFLAAICRWCIYTYPNRGDITIMGSIAPNSTGTTIIHLYSSSGKDENNNPRYCAGIYQNLYSGIYEFGFTDYVWYYVREVHTTDLSSYLQLSGGTMTGAVTFANGTYNTVGDDSQIGDINVAGTLGLRGYNGQTALAFVNQYGSSYGQYHTRLIAPVVTENHDIYLPGAGGTLALTSQIPTTLPANGGNADTVDNEHASAFLHLSGSSAITGSLILGTDAAKDLGSASKRWNNIYAVTTYATTANANIFYANGNNTYTEFVDGAIVRGTTGSSPSAIITLPSSTGTLALSGEAQPASDVYSWAKASTKPSYTYSEVGAAAAHHLYHTWDNNTDYYDSYEGGNMLRVITENMYADLFRFQASTVSNLEYHNGSSWVAWNFSLANLFDGDARTGISIPYTNRKFRFTMTTNGGWPTTGMFMLQGTWFNDGGFPSGQKSDIIIETRANESASWTQRATFTLSGVEGMACHTLSSLHTGETYYRITITIYPWTNTSNSCPLQRLCLFSNYNGGALENITHDGYGNVTIPTLKSTTIYENGTALSSKYLALSGGSLTGNLILDHSKYLLFRDGGNYPNSGVYYDSSGDESVIFANQHPYTGWMFVADMNPKNRTGWTSITPMFHIKNGGVSIGRQVPCTNNVANNALDVNGSIYATGYIKSSSVVRAENGTNGTVEIRSDSEGGNVTILSKTGVKGVDMDLYNDIAFRMYLYDVNPWEYKNDIILNDSEFFTRNHLICGGKLTVNGGGASILNTSSDTPLYVEGDDTNTYIGFKNNQSATLGYIGVNSSNKPIFNYNNTDTEISLSGHTHKCYRHRVYFTLDSQTYVYIFYNHSSSDITLATLQSLLPGNICVNAMVSSSTAFIVFYANNTTASSYCIFYRNGSTYDSGGSPVAIVTQTAEEI